MKNTINLLDFAFIKTGRNEYQVTYRSPTTGITWTAKTSNTPLIESTILCEKPKFKDLHSLKQICKNQ